MDPNYNYEDYKQRFEGRSDRADNRSQASTHSHHSHSSHSHSMYGRQHLSYQHQHQHQQPPKETANPPTLLHHTSSWNEGGNDYSSRPGGMRLSHNSASRGGGIDSAGNYSIPPTATVPDVSNYGRFGGTMDRQVFEQSGIPLPPHLSIDSLSQYTGMYGGGMPIRSPMGGAGYTPRGIPNLTGMQQRDSYRGGNLPSPAMVTHSFSSRGGGGLPNASPAASTPSPHMPAGGGGDNATSVNAQGRAVNKMLLDILRERVIDPQRLTLAIDTFVDRMDCVNLATLLFHTGKKRLTLSPTHIRQIAERFNVLTEELRAREASNALYGLKCLSSELPEVRELIYALARKIAVSPSEFVAQAVGNALYGLQMMSSEYEEVRYLILVLSMKVSDCTELLEAQNVGNALYGLRGMSSDYKEVKALISALTPKIANAREDLNGQALGNSLYGLQSMSSKEPEVRMLLSVLATKVTRTWEELKAQEVGNALYGLKRMSSDIPEVRMLITALVPKIASSPELLDAQAIGNAFYGLQNMNSHSPETLSLVGVLADKVALSNPELDGQAMGNSLYGLQGMSSEYQEVRNAVAALTVKIQHSVLEMNAQELGNALYGMQGMSSTHSEVRRLLLAMAQKLSASKHELGSQEIGNALFGMQRMSSEHAETRILVAQLSNKIRNSHCALDPQGVSNSIFGLQKLSSEAVEVRTLIQVLTQKIEMCWKPLSPHHIGYACYGMQQLSSSASEVKLLLKTLVTKILACREEMTAKQIAYALYGLHHMTGDNVETLAMVAAITEKVSLSNDHWSGTNLALSLFGLQGFSDESEEVVALLAAFNQKLSAHNTNNNNASIEMDPHTLANAVFGLQRMTATTTSSPEVIKLLRHLLPCVDRMVQQPELISPALVSNLMWGLQGKSVTAEPVLKLLQHCYTIMAVYLDRMKMYLSRAEINADIYQDLMRLYQCTTLSLFTLRDIPTTTTTTTIAEAEKEKVTTENEEEEENNNNKEKTVEVITGLKQLLTEMEILIEDNVKFSRSYPLSVAESNLLHDITAALPKETTSILTSTMIAGFDVAIAIQFYSNSSKTELESTVILEVVGSSYTFATKELFYRLRNQYFEQETEKIVVISMTADLFSMPGQQGLAKHLQLMTGVLSSGLESASQISQKRVEALEKIVNYLQQHVNPLYLPGTEYIDDEISIIQPTTMHEQMRLKITNTDGLRRPFGLLIGWVGMLPFFHSTGATPTPSPTHHNNSSGNNSNTNNNSSAAARSQVTPQAPAAAAYSTQVSYRPGGPQQPQMHSMQQMQSPTMAYNSMGGQTFIPGQGLQKPTTPRGQHHQNLPSPPNMVIPGSRLSGAYQPIITTNTVTASVSSTPSNASRPNSGDMNQLYGMNQMIPQQQSDDRTGGGQMPIYGTTSGSSSNSPYSNNNSYVEVGNSGPNPVMPFTDIRINTDPITLNTATAAAHGAGGSKVLKYSSRSPLSSAITPRTTMYVTQMTPIPESSSVETVVHGESGGLQLEENNNKGLPTIASALDVKDGPQEPEDLEILEIKAEIARLEKRVKELIVKKSMRLADEAAGMVKPAKQQQQQPPPPDHSNSAFSSDTVDNTEQPDVANISDVSIDPAQI